MGNENNTHAPSLQPVENLELPHLGTLTLMRREDQHCLLKTFSYADQFLMEDRFRKLKTRTNKLNNNNHILNIFQVHKQQKQQICANNYQILAYIEKPQHTLAHNITRKLQERKNYNEDQLLQFLAKVAESLIYLQDNGLKNVHLDTESIVVCGENVKVLDTGLAFSKSYLALLEHKEKEEKNEEKIYLAPELLKDIEDLNYDPYISPKADIFSLGMILMEMVTLESMQGYYDYHRSYIDYDSLIHRLSRTNHSLSFKTLIAEMLEYDPEERIGLISLKQKIQKLRMTDQGIVRSRSSKMLKEILSHSRRSSRCKLSEQSGSLTRQPSSDKKIPIKIQTRCSAKKQLQNSSKETEREAPAPLTVRPYNQNIMEQEISSTNQNNLKNLVKNKLNKTKEHTSKLLKPFKKDYPILLEPKPLGYAKTILQQSRSNGYGFNSSMRSNKFDDSLREKQNAKGVRATLNKLVEESGVKKLLKIQQLDISQGKKNAEDSNKNTSRFGSNEQEPSGKARTSRPSDIYIREYQEDQQIPQEEDNKRESQPPVRTLQKVMTFSKEFLLNARSVEKSIEGPPQTDQKLDFSQKSTEKSKEGPSSRQTEEKIITIKDIPVVISQQKTYLGAIPPPHFGKLQRQLNLMECIESVHHGSSLDNSFNNTSNVIESYRPRDEQYSSIQHEPYSSEMAQPFKKLRSKKPHLVLHLNQQEPEQLNSHQPRQQCRPITEQYRSNHSEYQISNFTSISPHKSMKDSIVAEDYICIHTSPAEDISPQKISESRVAIQYEGEKNNGIPHGNGILYNEGKVYYSGSFKQGKFSGYGTLHNLHYQPQPIDHKVIDLSQNYWQRFQGEFQQGSMTGFGTIFFSQGEKFSGCLKQGIVQGYGCFYRKNGELISGLWSQGKLRKV